MADLELILTKNDSVVRTMAPDELSTLSEAVISRLVQAANEMKEKMVRELRQEFRQDFNDRPRSATYGRETTLLIQHLEKSYDDSVVQKQGDTIDVLVFNLLHMDRATRNQGKWTESEGWFMKRIREGTGRTGNSISHGFISLARATELARQATANDSEDERQRFLTYVRINFAGRHTGPDTERGIMVPLDVALFFNRPAFGTARQHGVVPHPGSLRWTALKDLDGPEKAKKSGGQHWILQLIEKAVDQGMRKGV